MRMPTVEQALAAMQRVEPYLGRYSSSWCRKVLYSTLHHTAGAFDQAALKTPPLARWLAHDPWPRGRYPDLFQSHDLHWCQPCLRRGYHSMGHQLVGLTHCPMHRSPIRQGCPHCEFPVLMRTLRSVDSHEPFRNCLHCHKPLLDLTTSPAWAKTAKFLAMERGAFWRLFHWARREERLRMRVYPHDEGAKTEGHRFPDGQQVRMAIEAIHPLPPNVRVEPPLPEFRLTVVTLDRRRLREKEVTPDEQSELGMAMIEHLGTLPVPEGWLWHWRTGEVESPVPSCAAESSHFEFWQSQVFSLDRFNPPRPAEVLRPCMLRLVAARLVANLDEWVRRPTNPDQDLAYSIFFTDVHGALAYKPLGTYPGIIVEIHRVCRADAFGPPRQISSTAMPRLSGTG